MKDKQAVVVRWMTRQLDRLHWSAERWAKEAELAPTTVTRAMSPNYKSVSSVSTLHALARAAGVPSILDYLDTQSNLCRSFPLLAVILAELLPSFGVKLSDDQVTALSQVVGQSLITVMQQPDAYDNPNVARIVARAVKTTMLTRS